MGSRDYMELISSTECTVYGELEQKRKSGTWTKRYCAVFDKEFLSFKALTDGKAQVKFSLEGFNVRSCKSCDDEEDHPFSFQLSKPGVVDHLYATDSLDSLNKWIQKLIVAGVELKGISHDLQFPEEEKTGSLNLSSERERINDTSLPETPDVIEIADNVDGNAITHSKQTYNVNPRGRNTDEFPSLDITAATLITPLLHTSQSFDEANLKKINESAQLKRSDEIEDLLKINNEDEDDDVLIIKDRKDSSSDSDSINSFNSNSEDITHVKSNLEVNKDDQNVMNGDKTSENDSNTVIDESNPSCDFHDSLNETSILDNTNLNSSDNDQKIENSEDSEIKQEGGQNDVNENKASENDLNSIISENTSLINFPDSLSDTVIVDTNSRSSDKCEILKSEECAKPLNIENDVSLSNSKFSSNEKEQFHKIEQQKEHLTEKNNSVTKNFSNKNENNKLKTNKLTIQAPNNSQQYFGSLKRPSKIDDVVKDNYGKETDSQFENTLTIENEHKNISKEETQTEANMNNSNETRKKKNSLLDRDEMKILHNDAILSNKPEFERSTLDSDSEILKKVSVSELKEIFSAPSVNDISYQKANENFLPKGEQNHLPKRSISKTSNSSDSSPKLNDDVFIYPNLPQPEIESSVNITFESSPAAVWKRAWGVISGNMIKFLPNKRSPECLLSVPGTGLDIQPGAWDTGRLLAFKVMRNKKLIVIIEPDNVEGLGRWVSGLFRIIQQPVSQEQVSATSQDEIISSPSSSTLLSSENDSNRTVNPNGDTEAVSVKEIRSLFEEMKLSDSNPFSSTASIASQCSSIIQSVSSSQNQSLLDSTGSNQSIESHPSEAISFFANDNVSPNNTYIGRNISLEQRMMERFGAKYADVVCWLGRYIEQDQEQEILAKISNPFLAKLRLRHKIESITRLESLVDEKEKEMQSIKEKIAAKQVSKDNVQEKYRGRLIRNAEDARRISDDHKRIDKECANLETRFKKLEKEVSEHIDTIEAMYQEIEMDYEKFEYLSSNGSDHHQTIPREQTESKVQEELPEWTKKAKEKTEAWKTLSKEL